MTGSQDLVAGEWFVVLRMARKRRKTRGARQKSNFSGVDAQGCNGEEGRGWLQKPLLRVPPEETEGGSGRGRRGSLGALAC